MTPRTEVLVGSLLPFVLCLGIVVFALVDPEALLDTSKGPVALVVAPLAVLFFGARLVRLLRR